MPSCSQLKQSRRQVADLLRSGKSENARIRVESVMREEQMLQAYEGACSPSTHVASAGVYARSHRWLRLRFLSRPLLIPLPHAQEAQYAITAPAALGSLGMQPSAVQLSPLLPCTPSSLHVIAYRSCISRGTEPPCDLPQ